MVVGHLYVESRLVALIETRLFKPGDYVANLRFPAKVDLARALGLLQPEECSALKRLNKLRNEFAHHIDFGLTDAVINEFYALFIDPWHRRFIPPRTDDLLDDLRGVIMAIAVDLNAKTQLLSPLEPHVEQLHMQILDALAPTRPPGKGEGQE